MRVFFPENKHQARIFFRMVVEQKQKQKQNKTKQKRNTSSNTNLSGIRYTTNNTAFRNTVQIGLLV